MNSKECMKFADENGFYYHTATAKSVYKQLKNKSMMRVTGRVEFADDPHLRARLLEERPFLKAFIKNPNDPMLAIFRIPEVLMRDCQSICH